MSIQQQTTAQRSPDSLSDVLERVLDKGVVIAGDIVVNVLDIELLSLKLRLFVASAQTAQEMGMDWWTRDPFFSGGEQATRQMRTSERAAIAERDELRERVGQLEDLLSRHGIAAASEPAEEQR